MKSISGMRIKPNHKREFFFCDSTSTSVNVSKKPKITDMSEEIGRVCNVSRLKERPYCHVRLIKKDRSRAESFASRRSAFEGAKNMAIIASKAPTKVATSKISAGLRR